MKKAILLFASVFSGLTSLTALARSQNDASRIPFEATFNHVTGVTNVHLNGDAAGARYKIYPGPGRYCKIKMFMDRDDGDPIDPSDLPYLTMTLTYYDPALMEDGGQIENDISLKFKPTESRPTPLFPGRKWTSTLGNGELKSVVSYDIDTNTTNIEFHDTFWIEHYIWATIVTSPDHKEIKSVKVSRAYSKNTAEADRWSVFDCSNE